MKKEKKTRGNMFNIICNVANAFLNVFLFFRVTDDNLFEANKTDAHRKTMQNLVSIQISKVTLLCMPFLAVHFLFFLFCFGEEFWLKSKN